MKSALLSRRGFVGAAAALPAALRALAEPGKAARWVLLGTDTGAGIFRAAWNESSGQLGLPELAVKTARPGFLAMHPKLPRLYAANSVAGSGAAVSSFRVEAKTGALTFVDRESSRGDGPCCVSVDATGRSVFVANYAGGSFAALPLTVDGALLPATGTLHCNASPACGTQGPVRDRQDASHMHSATIAPGNDFVVACDLGNDAIDVFAIKPGEDNPLDRMQRFAARPGSGPRHVAFHPNARWLYVLHEIDCTVEIFDWSVVAGRATMVRRNGSAVSLLPAGGALTGNTGCEVIVGGNGRFVYASVRGVDAIVVFHIDEASGALTEQQRLSCGGKTPRHMAFAPGQRWLLSANQGTPGSVTVFAHNAQTGELKGPVQTVAAETPMFVQFI